MVLIPGGEFWMGTDSSDAINIPKAYPRFCRESWFITEFPKHKVKIDSFYIDKYEVTFRQFIDFIDSTGYKAEGEWQANYQKLDERIRDSCPVIGVSWNDAVAFSNWAGKRLPTEAEWEYAAKGPSKNLRYPWGNEVDLSQENVQNEKGPMPVGSFPANGYGVYDLGGNVQEWCEDYFDSTYYEVSPYENPTGPEDGIERVLRGGAWFQNAPYYSRTSQRNCFNSLWFVDSTKEHYMKRFGFRCAKSIEK
jgi:sulfatase modifying factor 1